MVFQSSFSIYLSNNQANDIPFPFSPAEMEYIIQDPLGSECPIQFAEMDAALADQVPMYNQLNFLLQKIASQGSIKLTPTGSLPQELVNELYSQKFLVDKYIESGEHRLKKESDSMTIALSHKLLKMTGLCKKIKNQLELTKTGEKALSQPKLVIRKSFACFLTKYNWSSFDGYKNPDAGKTGALVSILWLQMYGHEKHPAEFYAEKYYQLFPHLLKGFQPTPYATATEYAYRCYVLRSFDRFLKYFGLIDIEQKTLFNPITSITKTSLMDRLFRFGNKDSFKHGLFNQ